MKVVIIMNKISIRSILNITKFNLKVNRSNIIGWLIAIFSIMFLYMILFPYVKDIGAAKMEMLPEDMLKLFGLNSLSDMYNFINYFGMIFMIILVAISIYSATFSAKLICKEEYNKSIEFLNSLNVNRSEIYYSKVLTAFISVTFVLFGAFSSSLIAGLINGGSTFILSDFITIVKISSISAYIYLSVSFLISGITSKINVSSASSIVVLVSYMIGYLGVLLDKKWIMYFSPFDTLNATNVLSISNNTMYVLLIYFVIIVTSILLGNKFYKKRDLNI